MSVPLKILIIGPTKVGKSVLTNTISDFTNVVPTEYRPTVGCRILECEREFSEDQIKNTKYLKDNNISKAKIQLWDVSGDKK
jgi:Rab-like protein 5